jgi:methyl-accepting chemotaxis protein
MSLRARFTLLIGGLTAVVLLLFAGAFLYSERRHLLSQVEKVQGAKADLLAHACGQARLSRDQLTVLSLFKELMKSPGFVEAMCVDAAGKVILHSSLARIGNDVWGQEIPKTLRKTSFIESDRSLWAYDTLVQEGRALSGARLVFDPRPAQKATGEIFLETAARVGSVAAIILMVAVILSWAMARALTRPIVQLEEGARRVGGGDWSARVSEKGPGELGRLALEFNGMAKKLGVLDRMKDEFVHAVSHDLRNPLGAILASAKLLRGETSSSESQSLVEVVETSAVRLSAMVNDILDVACLQERALQFNRTVFALPPSPARVGSVVQPFGSRNPKKYCPGNSPPLFPPSRPMKEKSFVFSSTCWPTR